MIGSEKLTWRERNFNHRREYNSERIHNVGWEHLYLLGASDEKFISKVRNTSNFILDGNIMKLRIDLELILHNLGWKKH